MGVIRNALLIVGVIVTGCAPRAAQDLTPEAAAQQLLGGGDQALGPGDIFEVHVFNENDLTGTYRVGSDGTIDFPLVGQLRVQGLEAHAAGDLIARKLGEKFLRSPQVSVFIREQTSKKIMVLGQVAKPGTFPYSSNMTVIEAISVAGGFTPLASTNHATITRTDDGQKQSLEVHVDDISRGRARNVVLRPGDIIQVPERIF